MILINRDRNAKKQRDRNADEKRDGHTDKQSDRHADKIIIPLVMLAMEKNKQENQRKIKIK